MIDGAHVVIYSQGAEADRAFLRDVLELSHIDAGEGWLIYALPPAEAAVHPAKTDDVHELYFMCDDVDTLVARLSERGVACSRVEDMTWGRLTRLALPSGARLGVYEPRHDRPDVSPPSRPRST